MLTARILALWGSLAADGAPVANDGGGAGDDDDGAAPFAWPTFGAPRDGDFLAATERTAAARDTHVTTARTEAPPPSHRDGRDPSRPLSIATGVRHRRAAAGLARARGGFRHVERRWRGTTNIPPPASG